MTLQDVITATPVNDLPQPLDGFERIAAVADHEMAEVLFEDLLMEDTIEFDAIELYEDLAA